MAGFGNFAKNEKKKKKKSHLSASHASASATAPVFVLPRKIEKKRKEQ